LFVWMLPNLFEESLMRKKFDMIHLVQQLFSYTFPWL
jgi:hypothetical protein